MRGRKGRFLLFKSEEVYGSKFEYRKVRWGVVTGIFVDEGGFSYLW